MRNAEYKGRVESRNETRAAIPHSAFRTPHLGGVVKVLMAGGGTGGHLMPALALAQVLQDAGKGIEPVLVGAERGIEAQVLPRYPFRHHLLPMEPIYRRTWWNNVRALVTAGRAWRAVGRVLDAEQPVIVVGTGGYAAGPVVWRAQQRGLLPTRPTLLVFGGSQGARAINYAVAGALERRLLDEVNVVWGTGTAHIPALGRYAVAGRVVVQGFFDPMAPVYRAADLVVARAGAMTVAELCAWGKPSILVPLPTAAADHQTQNAAALAEAGAAIQLAEARLTPYTLAQEVTALVSDRARLESLGTLARGRGHPDAAREIVSKILTLIP